ncbi:hypothetical protein [uncultured Enterovirga sp.]|uniref:hypothetical protein n=1 Tax=uncultured Enterovirga sp. TaxID=2026352 RepID=UPI0035CBF01B
MLEVLGHKRARIGQPSGSKARPNDDDPSSPSPKPVERIAPDGQTVVLGHPNVVSFGLPDAPSGAAPGCNSGESGLPRDDVGGLAMHVVDEEQESPSAPDRQAALVLLEREPTVVSEHDVAGPDRGRRVD